MTFELSDLLTLLPETVLLGLTCAILIADLFIPQRSRMITYLMVQTTLVVTLLLILTSLAGAREVILSGTFVRDTVGDVLKIAVLLAAFVTFLYGRDYLRARDMFSGEYYVLGLFGVLGMMVLISAHSLLTLYLGLELLSLAMYAMVVLQRDSRLASEAAMKYFVLGAIASGMLLYGMSLLYGVTGSLDLAAIAAALQAGQAPGVILSFGLVFILIGVGFKLGAVPFHMWIPDVYHGAPTAVTLYIGGAPKIAAFAMLLRLLVEGMPGLHEHWQAILVVLAVLSMAVGNVLAIAQTNIKRMFAYSTISHVGFLILGVLTGTDSGVAASLFYTLTYVLMAVAGFGMILFLSRQGFEAEALGDYKGLNQRSPWYAAMMMVIMFSMAGVPPFLGFWAKLAVLEQVVAAGMTWLAVVGVVFSIIGAFYYLRIVKLMYFDKPEDTSPLNPNVEMRMALSLNSLAILYLGIFPGGLLALCQSAVLP